MAYAHVGRNGIAEGKARVAIQNPGVVGADTLSLAAILVQNLHVAIDGSAS